MRQSLVAWLYGRTAGWRGGLAALGFAVSLFPSVASAQTVASLPAPSASLERGGSARPVQAWVSFCDRMPAECAVDLSEPATIHLTPKIWRLLVSVNRSINTRIKPMTDIDHWNVVDRWDLPTDGYGDCEDFQLLKRKVLAEQGLSRRAMRMTVVIDDQGEGHAVMMIRTDRGDFILDNKRSAILTWQQTEYTFVKREGQDSVAWVALGERSSPVTTANR